LTQHRPPWLAFLLLAGAFYFLGTASAYAAKDISTELKTAQALLSAGDYAKAYAEYGKHAKRNPLAQFSLGLFHQFGWGRTADPAGACRWFGKAAMGNIPAAQHFFAECLRHGIHAPADSKAAAHWYAEAVKSGYLASHCPWAELHIAGSGVPKNPAQGLALCQQAAEKGLPSAQIRLGRFYLEEDAVRDYRKAMQWLETAARGNAAEGQYHLARMYRDGLGVEKNPVLARNWFEAAAGQGYLPAYLPAATLYAQAPLATDTGLLPETDLAKAYLWASAASKRLQDAERSSAEALLQQLLAAVPDTWRPDLDRKVAEHLARVAPPQVIDSAKLESTPSTPPRAP